MADNLDRLEELAAETLDWGEGASWYSSDDLSELGAVDSTFIAAASPEAVRALGLRVRDAEDDAKTVNEVTRNVIAKLTTERDAALAREAKVREAVARHPKCDRYDDGPISCGWKTAFRDVVRALDEEGTSDE